MALSANGAFMRFCAGARLRSLRPVPFAHSSLRFPSRILWTIRCKSHSTAFPTAGQRCRTTSWKERANSPQRKSGPCFNKKGSTISSLTDSRSYIPERPWSGEPSQFNSCRRVLMLTTSPEPRRKILGSRTFPIKPRLTCCNRVMCLSWTSSARK